MPLDGKGKFHINSQMASSSDKLEGTVPAGEGEGKPHELHAHGDGTYHTVSPEGERTEHPHLGHALMHMAAHHEPGAKHMHVMSDGMDHTTHHVENGGEVQGPHDHENIEAVKEHLGKFFDEEEHEGEGKQDGAPEEKGARGYGGSKESKDHSSLYL
jgi:hypothetical protein